MADDAQTLEHVHLLDDLVFLILSKLPLKSLKRFTCVCKLWALLFQNPHFMKIFLNNCVSNWSLSHNNQDTSLLVYHIVRDIDIQGTLRSSLFSLSNESIHNIVKLEWPNPFQEDDPNFYVLGSVNGILCLYQERNGPNKVVLWNPTTQESKVVLPSSVESVPPNHEGYSVLIGFGYDRVRDDYKVIRYVPDIPGPLEQGVVWEIYSLKSNSWRTLDYHSVLHPTCVGYRDRLYLDGMCHWTGCIEDGLWQGDRAHFEEYLVSFDLSNEVFYTTRMPLDRALDMPPSQYSSRYLLSLNESIAVITYPRDITRHTTYIYVSILGQVGVKESWTRLFVLELPCSIICTLGIGKKGNIFFVKNTDDSELIQFDLSTYTIEDLGVKGAKNWSEIVLYKESFLPIGEINN